MSAPRRRDPRPFRRTAAAVGALACVAALSACSAPRPGAAATVGSGRIEVGDLADRVDALVAIPALRDIPRVTLQREVLAELISDRVDDQVARKAGIAVSAGEVTAAIDSYKTATGATTDAQVEAALLSPTSTTGASQTPVGYAGLDSFARDNVLLGKLRSAAAAKAPVTEADLRALYAAHPTAFNSADIAAIVLSDPAKAQADYLKLVKNPAIFGSVAKIDSLSTQSGQNGGEIGSVAEGRLGPAIDAVLFAGRAGEILKPISDEGAYVIIRINSLTIKSYEQARADLLAEAKDPSGTPTVAAIGKQRQAVASRLGVWVNPRFGSWAGAASIPASGASAASVRGPDNPLATVAEAGGTP